MLLSIPLPGYVPFGFPCPSLAEAKKTLHLKLLGIRQSINFLDAGSLSHKALLRTGTSPMLFFTLRAPLDSSQHKQ